MHRKCCEIQFQFHSNTSFPFEFQFVCMYDCCEFQFVSHFISIFNLTFIFISIQLFFINVICVWMEDDMDDDEWWHQFQIFSSLFYFKLNFIFSCRYWWWWGLCKNENDNNVTVTWMRSEFNFDRMMHDW